MQFYADAWGPRWSALLEELERPARQVARINPFAASTETPPSLEHQLLAGADVLIPSASAMVLPRPQPGRGGLLDFYLMDGASIFPPFALDAQRGDEVLDMCAAPGGKSLILAQAVAEGGRLVSNEPSQGRRIRLAAVLRDYLSPEAYTHVQVTGHDGAKWCLYEKDVFDRILVDAPCSGERHLLLNEDELQVWSPARSKNLAVRQYALLVSALQVVRPGGRIVYSTCSISPLENDAVVSRLLKKRAGEARVIPSQFEIGEATEHGWMLLPDRCGHGPIYLSVLERVSD